MDTTFEKILVCRHPYENRWVIVGEFNDGNMHVVREGKNKRDLIDYAKLFAFNCLGEKTKKGAKFIDVYSKDFKLIETWAEKND